jgi:hypothetical protein
MDQHQAQINHTETAEIWKEGKKKFLSVTRLEREPNDLDVLGEPARPG